MPFTISLVTTDEVAGQALLEEVAPKVHEELLRLEDKFSAFKASSLVCRYQEGDLAPMADPEFQEVYTAVNAGRIETDGFFDPYYAGIYDPTGFVKGWAIEKTFKSFLRPLLNHVYIESVSLNGAGDMQFETAVTSDFTWRIGVENPDDLSQLVARFDMATGSIATSGLAKREAHLAIKGEQDLKQVTIVGTSLSWTDIWATAGFSAGRTEFDRLIARERLSGLYVTADGLHFFKGGVFET